MEEGREFIEAREQAATGSGLRRYPPHTTSAHGHWKSQTLTQKRPEEPGARAFLRKRVLMQFQPVIAGRARLFQQASATLWQIRQATQEVTDRIDELTSKQEVRSEDNQKGGKRQYCLSSSHGSTQGKELDLQKKRPSQ